MGDGADAGGSEARGLHSYKLYAPPLRSDLIGRKSILGRIFGADPAQVMLLQAPAGYGKSTTLRQIMSACDERGLPVGLADLRRSRQRPESISNSFRSSPCICPGQDAQPTADPTDHGDFGYRSDWAIERLLRFGKPAALFLDDFQVLENPAILKFFREFLDRIPDSVRVFIGSRSIPEIGLARLTVSGSCARSATRGTALFPLGGRAVFCEGRTNHRHRRRSHLSFERRLACCIATVSLVRGRACRPRIVWRLFLRTPTRTRGISRRQRSRNAAR